jgi:hypothetical protein
MALLPVEFKNENFMKKMRSMIGLLPVLCMLLLTCGKATFAKAGIDGPTSLWHDKNEFYWTGNVSGEEVVFGMTEPERTLQERSDSMETSLTRLSIVGTTIIAVMAFFVLFFTAKWSFLALMLTDYEKFQQDMRDHYYRKLVEDCYIPYHDCKAWHFLFNFRVWTVKQALSRCLDTFSQHDYWLWKEDNSYRPQVRL